MMAELGKHAFEVTLAYAGGLALLAALIAVSAAQARRRKQRLDDAESRHARD